MPRRDRILISLALLLVLVLSLSCNPNPPPDALTPIPTLAPGPTLTLVTELQEPPEAAEPVAETEAGTEADTGDAAAGEVVFQNCVACHGADAQGDAIGPTLVNAELKAKDDDHYRQTIANGVAGTAMPPWGDRLSAQDIEDVIAFLRSKQ